MNCKTVALSILALLLACQPARAQYMCPADVTGDLTANVNDLLAVIGDWGAPSGPADANQDGVVDINDLLIVLNGWGPCDLVFVLDELPESGGGSSSDKDEDQGSRGDNAFDGAEWCIYRVDTSAPGSALVAGDILCIRCPLTWFDACPNLAAATFNDVPGNGPVTAPSTGVNVTRLGSGFCQHCPLPEFGPNARRYRAGP